MTYDNMLKALQKAEATKTSFITADEIGAPTIYGAKIYGAEIYAGGVNEKGGQVIGLTDGGINIYDGSSIANRVLTISKGNDGDAHILTGHNFLHISTPALEIEATNEIAFDADIINFSKVNEIIGLHATFA